MTVDVVQQGRALCQALLLGGAMGVVYDLFRILRVRVKVPLLGPLLDLLFWLAATAALFLWSQSAWGGQVRLLRGGRSPVFLGSQPLAAAVGVSGGRPDDRSFGHFDLSAGGRQGNSEKNQKNYKKRLPFRDEMV